MQANVSTIEISIVIPAFNEGEIIGVVVSRIREVLAAYGQPYEIIVVDDGSTDETAARAMAAGAEVHRHPYNIGNGAAVKSGIRRARGKYLILMDGDGQHDPTDIPRFIAKLGTYDMVVGARSANSHRNAHRTFANSIFNGLATYICNRRIEDLTSGYRAIRTAIARRFLYLLPNTFSYPTTITMAIVRAGHSLTYLPIDTKARTGESKIRIVSDGIRFLVIIVKIATLFSPFKIFLPVSILMFGTGLGYGLLRIFALKTSYGPTSAMLMIMAVVIFMVGLVSEQVAQLRFDRSETTDN